MSTNLETRIMDMIDDTILPLSGLQIYGKLSQDDDSLLSGDVARCIWKLVEENKVIVRLDLKIIRKNDQVNTSHEFENDYSHARRAIRDFLEGRIDRIGLHDSAVALGIIPDQNETRTKMQALVEKLFDELSWARAKLHEFDNEKITK